MKHRYLCCCGDIGEHLYSLDSTLTGILSTYLHRPKGHVVHVMDDSQQTVRESHEAPLQQQQQVVLIEAHVGGAIPDGEQTVRCLQQLAMSALKCAAYPSVLGHTEPNVSYR